MLIGDVHVGWASLGRSPSDDCGEHVGVAAAGVLPAPTREEKWRQGWSFAGAAAEDGLSVWNASRDNISDAGDGEGASKGAFA